jgi:HAD superfamily hydrolase (TIGR01509 family)
MNSDLKNIRAVVFDMDGLLLDSERVAIDTFVDACRECDYEPDLSVYYRCIGTTFDRVQDIMREGYGREFPIEKIIPRWERLYHDFAAIKPIPLKAGAQGLLTYLEKSGVRKVVVTSTYHESASRRLANAKIARYFDFILGGDEISHGKPDPEIYSTACRKLSEEPAGCLALEDSDNGVLSATGAGLTVIQVPDLVTPSPKVKSLGHRIVGSLADVTKMLQQSATMPARFIDE